MICNICKHCSNHFVANPCLTNMASAGATRRIEGVAGRCADCALPTQLCCSASSPCRSQRAFASCPSPHACKKSSHVLNSINQHSRNRLAEPCTCRGDLPYQLGCSVPAGAGRFTKAEQAVSLKLSQRTHIAARSTAHNQSPPLPGYMYVPDNTLLLSMLDVPKVSAT
jgi:hypothetical protein